MSVLFHGTARVQECGVVVQSIDMSDRKSYMVNALSNSSYSSQFQVCKDLG